MEVIDTPRTGKLGPFVFYTSPFGQCCRSRTVPRNPKSERQSRMRAIFGSSSHGWGVTLTEDQRQRWVTAALTAPSHPSLSQYSHLSSQQFYVQINSTLMCIGQAPVDEPPAPVAFGPSPIGDLLIDNEPEDGVRLRLTAGTVNEDIMVFGQPPCSAGRMKHRRVYFLGLLGPAANGQWDITGLYTARFGQPAPGQKVFIVTRQTGNGWTTRENTFSAIVSPSFPSGKQQVAAKKKLAIYAPIVTPAVQESPAKGYSPLRRAVYKGSTQDARREHKGLKREHLLSILCTPLVHSALRAIQRLMMPGMKEVSA